MNVERISRTIQVLEAYDGPFNVHEWESCAIGIICNDSWFRREGLHMRAGIGTPRPVFSDLEGWTAVQLFFGMSGLTARYVFGLLQEIDKDTIVDRLKHLLKKE